ncbi:unnamed protein product, partial [Prorocentrum cordatum]
RRSPRRGFRRAGGSKDQHGRVYFANVLTSGASWTHPLAPQLKEIVDVFRMCSDSKDIPEVRDLAVSTLLATWQEEAQKALEPWVPFTDAAGLPCFHNWVIGEFTCSTLHLSIPYGST